MMKGMRTCSIGGCDARHYARDYCLRHYMQWFRTGQIRWAHKPTDEERIWGMVDKTPDCWLWTGNLFATGYGQVKYQGKTRTAHRVIWTMERGELPKGSVLHHECGVKRCVRLDHLHLLTRQSHADEHRERGNASGHGHETHCPAGHPYDDVNTYRDKKGSRHCRVCIRDRKRLANSRKRSAAAAGRPDSPPDLH